MQFGRVQFRLHHKLEPEPKFGHPDGPFHHIHAVQLLAEDARPPLVGGLASPQHPVAAGLQVVQQEEHADEERTGANGRVADRNPAHTLVQPFPQAGVRNPLIGIPFFFLQVGEHPAIQKIPMFLSHPAGQPIHQRQPAHQVDLGARGIEDAGPAAQVSLLAGFKGHVDQTLVDPAEHLRVHGHLFVPPPAFHDGKVVALEEAGGSAVHPGLEEEFEESIG